LPHYRKLQTLNLSITAQRLIYIELNLEHSILVSREEQLRILAAETGNKEKLQRTTFHADGIGFHKIEECL
jgi:hypothetical protein